MRQGHHATRNRPRPGILEHPNAWVCLVAGAVHAEGLGFGVRAICTTDVDDAYRLVADEQSYAIRRRGRRRAEDDWDGERLAAGQAAAADDRLIVLRAHERVEWSKTYRREHEEVRQLALADLEPRQRPRLHAKSEQLVA